MDVVRKLTGWGLGIAKQKMLEGISASFIDLFLLWPLEELKWCQFSWLMFGTEKWTRESRVQPFFFVWMGWYLKSKFLWPERFVASSPSFGAWNSLIPPTREMETFKKVWCDVFHPPNGVMEEKFFQNILSVNQTKEVHRWGIFSSISLFQKC